MIVTAASTQTHSTPNSRHLACIFTGIGAKPDSAYAGPKLREAISSHGDWTIEIVKRSDTAKGFLVLPRR